jgi:prepilin peptidase CpaA
MPALIEVARWTTLLLVCLVLTIAGASDVRTRRIPNWTVLAIVALFCAWYFVGPAVPILSALGAALVVFIGSFALYSFGIVGAGDSKLATSVALFAGIARLPEFILYMSLTGGVLVLCNRRGCLSCCRCVGEARWKEACPMAWPLPWPAPCCCCRLSPNSCAERVRIPRRPVQPGWPPGR